MNKKKKILSIEDRIPKLKEKRKKKANRRIIFYVSIFFFLISIIVYLQSSLSNVQVVHVNGNHQIEEDAIIKETSITDQTNIWTIKTGTIEKTLKKNPFIKTAEVKRKLPREIEVNITEYKLVGYIEKEGVYHPLLEDGTVLTEGGTSAGDAPIMLGFDDEEYLDLLTEELNDLPSSILHLISEIHWKPIEGNQNKILLYMNDGFVVDGTIRNFSEKMKVYPSIVSQLDEDQKGIIHIGVGAYFEAFEEE